jgi:phosphoribosyl-AMP cyclohydrolase
MYSEAAIHAALNALRFDHNGLIPAIAQDADSGLVLMLAWMNREAVTETLRTGQVVYWSRSRNALWRKGETSGQTQTLVDFRFDCDEDALLLKVHQTGTGAHAACHTGRASCFSWGIGAEGVMVIDPVMIDPSRLYT